MLFRSKDLAATGNDIETCKFNEMVMSFPVLAIFHHSKNDQTNHYSWLTRQLGHF